MRVATQRQAIQGPAGALECAVDLPVSDVLGVAVVYPEAVWYTYVDADDIDEIVESHLKNGQVVKRLLTPKGLGR